jgi:hypothetical protein
MVHPTSITMLIGTLLMAALVGIDWFVWGRSYGSDFRRKPEIVAKPERPGQGFKRAA